jgi:hypothetical protein
MRDLTGRYRARGENSKTGGGVVGEMTLTHAGTLLVGTYRFWEERDTEPVSFNLPWHDCDVAGEVCSDQMALRGQPPAYHEIPAGGWDITLRVGDQDLHGVLIAGGHIALSSRNDYFALCETFYRQPHTDERSKPFVDLIARLWDLGSANDAADRGYLDVADRLRDEAYTKIRALIDAYPAICEVLPDLPAQLADGSLAYVGWSTQIDRAHAYLDTLSH